MRDLALYAHITLGILIIILAKIVLSGLKSKAPWAKPLSAATALVSWLMLVPAGFLYLVFYPATKTLIKAGTSPWAHSIVMETKEHWGIMLPVIATVAAGLVFTGKTEESKKWWTLLIILAAVMAVMGVVITRIGGAS